MKKILILACLFMSTLCAFAINISLSDGNFGMNADITKEGNNVRMKYKIKGMNNASNFTKIPEEQQKVISNIGDVNFDILASCSEPKVKILAMSIYDTTGKLMTTVSDTDWGVMDNREDIDKLKQICDRL